MFPRCQLFTDEQEFFTLIAEQNKTNHPIDFVVICTPDYLHSHFIKLALEAGSNVLCEKPIVCEPTEIDDLMVLENQSDKKIFGVLQGRWYAHAIEFRKRTEEALAKNSRAKMEWIAPRNKSYENLWRGDPEQAAGLIMDIGIHSLDILCWMFGSWESFRILDKKERSIRAEIIFENMTVDWFLSIGEKQEESGHPEKIAARRSFKIGDFEMDLTRSFTDLHAKLYQSLIKNEGLGLVELLPSIKLAYEMQRQLEESGHVSKDGHLFACSRSRLNLLD